jgi:hypothetical protein
MRVDPKLSAASVSSPAATRTPPGQRFTLDGSAPGARTQAAAATLPLATLDALIAVQGEGDVTERRRRSVRRGRDLLEALDQLKAGILSGTVGGAQLQRLASHLGAQRQPSGDAALDELIGHIELRAQVELAKLGRA